MRRITISIVALICFISATAQTTFTRRGAQVPKTETVPQLNAVQDAEIYTGDGFVINRWNSYEGSGGTVPVEPTPIEGVESRFWFAYDEDHLYVFTTIDVPSDTITVELGVTVSIDVEEINYGWQADPLGEDGFVFSKAVFGTDLQENEITRLRQFDYIYAKTPDGYEAEVKIAWNDLTTDMEKVTEFKERGIFYFDIGYKLSNADATYFAWSNDDNRSWRETYKTGIVNFELVRKEAMVARTSTPPVMNAVKDAVYTGDGYPVELWTTRGPAPMMPTPVEGVDANFWFVYDDDNLYVFGEINVPDPDLTTELGVMVSIDENDADYGWQADPLGEDGFVFSKAVFGLDLQPDEIATLRLFDYIYSSTPDGYEFEVKIPWDGLTTDAAKVAAFRQRGTFFFDIGFKMNEKDSTYFAWSNNDNRTWRETFKAGIITLEPGVFAREAVRGVELSVFPNPASNVLYINSENPVSVAEVYNIIGARVLSADVQSGSLDISGLKEGVYVIRVSYENGKTGVSRFVKN
jgi:hypothetical protein